MLATCPRNIISFEFFVVIFCLQYDTPVYAILFIFLKPKYFPQQPVFKEPLTLCASCKFKTRINIILLYRLELGYCSLVIKIQALLIQLVSDKRESTDTPKATIFILINSFLLLAQSAIQQMNYA